MWLIIRGKKMKKWMKMKKERSLLECLFQKRVIYTQVNWEWNIRSDTRASDTLAFPHIYLIIHTYWGNPIFNIIVIPHATLGQFNFHLYLYYPVLSPYQDKQSFIAILIIPLVHTNWGNCKAYFLSWPAFYTTLTLQA